MTRQAFFLIWFLALFYSSNAQADGFLAVRFNLTKADERQEAAKYLLKSVNRFGDLIQMPKPADASWVKSEEAAIANITNGEDATSRSSRLIESPEFQQVKLYNYIEELRSALHCIIQRPKNLRRETYCWSIAASILGDSTVFMDGQKILTDAKRLPDNPSQIVIYVLFDDYSLDIQKKIVIPYIHGDLR